MDVKPVDLETAGNCGKCKQPYIIRSAEGSIIVRRCPQCNLTSRIHYPQPKPLTERERLALEVLARRKSAPSKHELGIMANQAIQAKREAEAQK